MTVTISRLYDNYTDAQQAVRRLEAAGVPHSDISLVANNSDSWFNSDKKVDRDHDGVDDRSESAGKGAGIGAGIGGTAGLLAGLGLLAIPGLEPVVAAGWVAATAVGAAAGAATGGIVGALTEAGVSEADAHTYAEGVRRGGTLVSARVADAERARLEAGLNESSVNLRGRSAAWQKNGWKSFDPASKPYGADEVRKERALWCRPSIVESCDSQRPRRPAPAGRCLLGILDFIPRDVAPSASAPQIYREQVAIDVVTLE